MDPLRLRWVARCETYYYHVKARNSGGEGDWSNAVNSTQDATLPASPAIVINDGARQRSLVSKATLSFTEPVTLDASAITLTKRDGTPATNTVLTVANPSGDQRNWVATFSGAAVINGSVADGIYDIRVRGSAVHDRAGNTMAGNATARFHRLFGDSDGDRDVDNNDLLAFKRAFTRPSEYASYDYFNFDGSGPISLADYAQLKARLVRTVLR